MNSFFSISLGLLIVAFTPNDVFAQQTPAEASSNAHPDWAISVGAGVVSAPRSFGLNRQRTIVVPGVDVRYRDWFFANLFDGVGVESKHGSVTLRASVLGVDFNSRDPKDDPRLRGTTKVGSAPTAKLEVGYAVGEFDFGVSVASRLASSQKRGTTAQLQAGYNVITTRSLLATIGINTTLMDSTFARNLISISAADAQRTGLRVFNAGSGQFKSGLYGQAVYRFDNSWALFSRLEFSRLQSDAANSPLVQKKNIATGAAFISYSF